MRARAARPSSASGPRSYVDAWRGATSIGSIVYRLARLTRKLAERLFTDEACREILRDFVEETGVLRQKTADQRRQLQSELDGIERRLQRWAEAFETGELSADLGAELVVELRAKRDEVRETIRKIVPLRPPPPHLYGEVRISREMSTEIGTT